MAQSPPAARRLLIAVAALSSVAGGCATKNGGDPALGSFNRPITPTPPPTGPNIGGALDTPGVYPAPGVGANVLNPNEFPHPSLHFAPTPNANGYWVPPSAMTAEENRPLLKGQQGSPRQYQGLPRGAALNPTAQGNFALPTSLPGSNAFGPPPNAFVAPAPQPSPSPIMAPGPAAPGAFPSGAGVTPTAGFAPQPAPVRPAAPVRPDVSAIATVEQGRDAMTRHGFAKQYLEQVGNGDWKFVAVRPDLSGTKQYEATHPNQLEAVRLVIGKFSADPAR